MTVYGAPAGDGIEDFGALAGDIRALDAWSGRRRKWKRRSWWRPNARRREPRPRRRLRRISPDRAALVDAVGPAEALAAFGDGDGILLGRGLATRLGLGPGDSATLISPESRATVVGHVPRARAYPVLGTFHLGMSEYDGLLVLMPLAPAQRHFRLPDRVNAIEVFVEDPDAARDAARRISRRWGRGAARRPGSRGMAICRTRSPSSATSCS